MGWINKPPNIIVDFALPVSIVVYAPCRSTFLLPPLLIRPRGYGCWANLSWCGKSIQARPGNHLFKCLPLILAYLISIVMLPGAARVGYKQPVIHVYLITRLLRPSHCNSQLWKTNRRMCGRRTGRCQSALRFMNKPNANPLPHIC